MRFALVNIDVMKRQPTVFIFAEALGIKCIPGSSIPRNKIFMVEEDSEGQRICEAEYERQKRVLYEQQ